MRGGTETILGISLCTYISGIAVYSDRELLDWKLRYFRGKWSEAKSGQMLAAFEKIAWRYNVTHIALKLPEEHFQTNAIRTVAKEIEKLAIEKGMALHIFTLNEMKYHFSGKENVTKRFIIEKLAGKYPDLFMHYEKATKEPNSKYERIYEAAGAIELCRHEIMMRKQD